MKQTTAGALAGLGIAAILTGVIACGASDDTPVTYAPAAYYQVVGDVYECYYLASPAEAEMAKSLGQCPAGAIDTPMPVSYQETYWSYWSSPAYYNTYMPSAARTRFVSVTVVSNNRSSSFTGGVTRYSSSALYKGSNGSTVKGSSKVSTTSFGGGSRTTQSYGGGSRSNSGSSSSRSSYTSRSAGRK